MRIERIDHFVITAADVDATVAFYVDGLGMALETFGDGRKALRFGGQKINLHQAGAELRPHAARPTVGGADFCLISSTPMDELVRELAQSGVAIEEGPSRRTGATGPILSVYVRDPDGNLVEISNEMA